VAGIRSEVFTNPETSSKRDVDGRVIDGFSMFKKNIRPDYDEVVNREGAELACRKYFTPETLDTYWENLVLGLIGETIDEDDQICGCRVVDKSTNRPMYRLELWFKSKSNDVSERLRVRTIEALVDGDTKGNRNLPDFQLKKH